MNPNCYNPYLNTNPNVGSGWSSNYNYADNNQFPTQTYGSGPAPPQIGFIVPGYTQPINYNQNQMDYNSNANYSRDKLNISPGQSTHHDSPIASAPQLTNNFYYSNPSNSGSYQMNTNVPNPQEHNQTAHNSMMGNRISTPNSSNIVRQSAVAEPPQQQKQPNLPSKNIEPKSDYQKGLDKLAELMNDDVDLNKSDMEKMRRGYDLNR